ncbi:gas vesicle protein GvpG [Gracilibacillus salitolerans]|uniref:Gas vesicle protein GvpG n=1 Tax=Gracilibacillus salitolerans TaxID=2663022 RepID=A0A5Q2TPN3_9BACI|nr:gas vesicle protein GvpG [Gracilibacillus salitolerans]QGH36776.1 gas vesicle protein GvpG [Gracilibacillus salitolerans]
MLQKIVTAPIDVLTKIGEKVKEEADKEFYDLSTIQRKLVYLQTMYEQGEIPEVDYQKQEEELLARYEQAKRIEMEQWQRMTERK